MRKLALTLPVVFMLVCASAAFTYATILSQKLPKCSGQLCRDAGCSPDVLCVSGSKVKNCADVCRGK